MNITIKAKPLIVSLLLSLGIGILSSFFTMGSMQNYNSLTKPVLSPPSFIFPIVWTILFILMAISAYLIYESKSPYKKEALILYALQLAFNFFWPIIFFGLKSYLFAFIWLLILWLLIALMIIVFYNINPVAGLLQIPYLIWVTFAGYLNLAIYFLNK